MTGGQQSPDTLVQRAWACPVPEGLGSMLPVHIHEKGPKLLEDSQRCAVPVDGAPGGLQGELSVAAGMCRSPVSPSLRSDIGRGTAATSGSG